MQRLLNLAVSNKNASHVSMPTDTSKIASNNTVGL